VAARLPFLALDQLERFGHDDGSFRAFEQRGSAAVLEEWRPSSSRVNALNRR
jgi:hypothetical protein